MDHIILDCCDESKFFFCFFFAFFKKALLKAFVETFPNQRFAIKGEQELWTNRSII